MWAQGAEVLTMGTSHLLLPPSPASVLFTVGKLNNTQAPKFILSYSIHHLLSGIGT